MEPLKVGELARRTGLSIRTLHHYEAVGLLAPAQRTRSGHRLYGESDIGRLHRILALKQLGMSLEDIRAWLAGERFSILDGLRIQRARVRDRIAMLRAVDHRLELIEQRMRASTTISVDDVLETLEAMAMFEKYYTREQLDQLEQRRIQLGDETIRNVEHEWPELIAKVKAAMERGVEPGSEEARALGRRWKELVELFTGGDPAIAASLGKLYQNEPSVRERTGLDDGIFRYVEAVLKS